MKYDKPAAAQSGGRFLMIKNSENKVQAEPTAPRRRHI